MLDLLVLTVVLPLLAAGGILLWNLLSSGPDARKNRLRIAAAVLLVGVLIGVAIAALDGGRGGRVVLASLYPSVIVESMVEMRWDAALWPLGMGLAVSMGALLLQGAASSGSAWRRLALVLLLLTTGLAALWSANPLTTMVCWALYDLVGTVSQIHVGVRGAAVVRSLALGTAADLLLWVGVLREGGGIGSVQWALMPTGGAKMTFWALAGLLRMGAYPFQGVLPEPTRRSSPLGAALQLSPVLGWGLLARLAFLRGRVLPLNGLMVLPALLTGVVGAILAWTTPTPRKSRRWISLSMSGYVLAGISMISFREAAPEAGVLGALLMLGVVGWLCGTVLLFLGGGCDPHTVLQKESLYRALPSLIGALSLIGAPATAGFLGVSSLMMVPRAVMDPLSGGWAWSAAFFSGQVFLVASVGRWLFEGELIMPTDRRRRGREARAVGLWGLALIVILVGVIPHRFVVEVGSSSRLTLSSLMTAPSLAGWMLWIGASLLGAAVAWADRHLRPEISLWLEVIHDVVRLEWAYELVIGAVEQGLGLVRAVDDVVGGEGALLWAIVISLIIVLMGGV